MKAQKSATRLIKSYRGMGVPARPFVIGEPVPEGLSSVLAAEFIPWTSSDLGRPFRHMGAIFRQ